MVDYFVQSVNIPGLTLGQADYQTPFVKLPVPGDHLQYSNLMISFKIDEEMENYLDLHNWLVSLGFPDNYNQTKPTWGVDKNNNNNNITTGIYSDAQLSILTNSSNQQIIVDFFDIYPISLSQVQFNSVESDINYITAQAQFIYRKFNLKKV